MKRFLPNIAARTSNAAEALLDDENDAPDYFKPGRPVPFSPITKSAHSGSNPLANRLGEGQSCNGHIASIRASVDPEDIDDIDRRSSKQNALSASSPTAFVETSDGRESALARAGAMRLNGLPGIEEPKRPYSSAASSDVTAGDAPQFLLTRQKCGRRFDVKDALQNDRHDRPRLERQFAHRKTLEVDRLDEDGSC